MIVKHPRIPNVEVDVPESDVARWASQGWVADEPTEPTEATDDKPARPARKPRKG